MEISLILGVVVGVVLGLTGAGGGILAVPALVNGMGWSVQEATPVALIAVASGAALGAFDGLRKGLVRYKAALVMVIGGIPFTKVGLAVAQRLPQTLLLVLFAGLTLFVVVRLVRHTLQKNRPQGEADHAVARIDPATGRFR